MALLYYTVSSVERKEVRVGGTHGPEEEGKNRLVSRSHLFGPARTLALTKMAARVPEVAV